MYSHLLFGVTGVSTDQNVLLEVALFLQPTTIQVDFNPLSHRPHERDHFLISNSSVDSLGRSESAVVNLKSVCTLRTEGMMDVEMELNG